MIRLGLDVLPRTASDRFLAQQEVSPRRVGSTRACRQADPPPDEDAFVIVLAISHSVEDYDTWKTVYDEGNPVKLGGALFARLNRRVDDPNIVAAVAGFESVEAAEAFINNPVLKSEMERAGVSSPPRIEMYEEVEVVTA
jgi:hypothetical protein